MLLRLPREIVFHILSFLTFQNRLNLVKTCRHLRNVILEGHLYEELPRFESDRKLRDALNLFKNYPLYGSQVKRLDITTGQISAEVLIQLPMILPNIRAFKTSSNLWNIKESEIEMLLRWRETLEKYHVEEDGLRISHLLKYNIFSHLSSLTMALPPTFFYKYEKAQHNETTDRVMTTKSRVQKPNTNLSALQLSRRIQTNNNFAYQMMKTTRHSDTFFTNQNFQFFDCFRNTPSLKHLTLLGGNMYVEYLEKLHEVCPQLASLSLSVKLSVGDIDAMPSFIEPVTQLLSLKLNPNSYFDNSRNGVLNYLAAKYTKLNELVLLSSLIEGRAFHFLDIDPQNNTYSMEWEKKTREFICHIPSTIKILKLNTLVFENPIASLQESAIDPTELAFYHMKGQLIPAPVVVNPKQLDYFKNLTSLNSLTLEWNRIMEALNDGPISEKISHLTVQIPEGEPNSDPYALNAIFLAYPALKSLTINKRSILQIKRSPVTIGNSFSKTIYPNLRSLSLYQITLDHKIAYFIQKSLPNLKDLMLTVSYPLMKTEALINLEGCNLDTLILMFDGEIPSDSGIVFYLQVNTLDGLTRYKVKVANTNRIDCITKPEEDIPANEMVRVVCKNIKTLKINGMTVKLFLDHIL